MGDPSGIGPEVAIHACSSPALRRSADIVFVGDPQVFEAAAKRLGRTSSFRAPKDIHVDAVASLAAADRRPGKPTPAGAEAAYRSILRAVELVRTGEAEGIVTAPVNKHAIQSIGYDFPGHTETIAGLAGGVDVRMMLAGPTLRVVLATTHIRLRDVPAAVTVEGVARTAEIADDALRRDFGIRRPRLALAGLNPHAGEQGSFGDEEIRILAPAIDLARARGVLVDGPHPPDTIFFRARSGDYDAVLSLYHDQGLGPFKLVHFHDGVNVTLGLPFPRTSPDHGTAYDIAGKNRADATSMAAAVRLATTMALSRRSPVGRSRRPPRRAT
jgi:4-hydroxythreonine-4-phosphate dehydrogenase